MKNNRIFYNIIALSLFLGVFSFVSCGGGKGGGVTNLTPTPPTFVGSAEGYVYKDGQNKLHCTQGPISIQDFPDWVPIAGVKVSLIDDTSKNAFTDSNGKFKLQNILISTATETNQNINCKDILIEPPKNSDTPPLVITIAIGANLPLANLVNIYIIPSKTSINLGDILQFFALGIDNNGIPLVLTNVTWSISSGSGRITNNGIYIAPTQKTEATIKATLGTLEGEASISVKDTTGRASITGQVKYADGTPVWNAFVLVNGTCIYVLTNSQGIYLLNGVPAGEQKITIIKDGDILFTTPVSLDGGEVKELDITITNLTPTPTPLPSVTPTSTPTPNPYFYTNSYSNPYFYPYSYSNPNPNPNISNYLCLSYYR